MTLHGIDKRLYLVEVEVPGMMETDGSDDKTGSQAIGKQCIVGVMLLELCHNFPRLWVEDELATLQPDGRVSCHTSAFHHLLYVINRKMFHFLLPDVAVLALRLASCGGINHQLRQPLVSRSHDVVQIEAAIVPMVQHGPIMRAVPAQGRRPPIQVREFYVRFFFNIPFVMYPLPSFSSP